MRPRPYPKYKPSGVEWLGDVPEHWEVCRLKYVATLNDEALPETTDPGFELSYIDIGSVDAVAGITTTETFFFENAPSRARRIVRDGDTIISTVRTYLKAIAAIIDPAPGTIVSTGFAVVRPRSLDPRFLSYALREERFVEAIVARSAGVSYPACNASEVAAIPIVQPPRDEQRAIAGFLDRETGRIDGLIAKKRELIGLLAEKRQALISRCVTRGLPPAAARAAGLDPHPKTKDSGIEWLGEIPEHWETRKFSREVSVAEGQVDPEVEPYCDMVLIGPNHVASGTGVLLKKESAADQAAESGKYICNRGDVVYSKIRPALAKVAIADDTCLCSADMYPLRGSPRIVNRFLYWTLLSDHFTAWSTLKAERVAMPKINRETLNELRFPVPPNDEQTAIATHLDRETSRIDAMVEKVEEAVERLREYRTALVTAAVTGKIDVRDGCEATSDDSMESPRR